MTIVKVELHLYLKPCFNLFSIKYTEHPSQTYSTYSENTMNFLRFYNSLSDELKINLSHNKFNTSVFSFS